MISVIGITEVLLARIVSGRTCCSISREGLLLQRHVFQHRLDDVVGLAHAIGQIRHGPHAVDRRLVVAEIAQVGRDPRSAHCRGRLVRVGDRHVMAGERKHLRDAVAHQARADHRDARFPAMRQPAV